MKIIKTGENRYRLALGDFIRTIGAGNRAAAKAMFEREVRRVWHDWQNDSLTADAFINYYDLTPEEQNDLLRIIGNDQTIH